MVKGMAAHFMALFVDPPDLRRVVIGPLPWQRRRSHHGKTGRNRMARMYLEEFVRIRKFERSPIGTPMAGAERSPPHWVS